MGLGSEQETLELLALASSARGTPSPEKQKQYRGQRDVRILQMEIDAMDNQVGK
jgi:hypothetical protein